jgi:hypothetical protein
VNAKEKLLKEIKCDNSANIGMMNQYSFIADRQKVLVV